MLKKSFFALSLFAALAAGSPALAHTPLCSCWDNGQGRITCEGGFSDGSSASGVAMYVKGPDGKVIAAGKIDEVGEFSFDKPAGEYQVEFNAGEGHLIVIPGKDILE
ncbi:MAG: hypothetical protein V1816_04335 [Pseudomonadota bacterium]